MCFIELMSLCACAYVCVYASVCLYLFVYAEHGGLFHRAVAQDCSLWLRLWLRCLAWGKHDPQTGCKDCEWCRKQWPGSGYACGVVRYACGAVGLWCVACVCGMSVVWCGMLVVWCMRAMVGKWLRGLVRTTSFCIYYTQRFGGLWIFLISWKRGFFCICYTLTYRVSHLLSTPIHHRLSTHIDHSVLHTWSSIYTHMILYLHTHDPLSTHMILYLHTWCSIYTHMMLHLDTHRVCIHIHYPHTWCSICTQISLRVYQCVQVHTHTHSSAHTHTPIRTHTRIRTPTQTGA